MKKNNIGKELRLIRKYNKLSLRDLSEMTNVSYSRLGKYERGEEVPTDNIIRIIENTLKIDFNELSEIARKIDIFYDEFYDSLFYNNQDFEYCLHKINNYKKEYNINSDELNFKNAKILLMEYIINILNNELANAQYLEDLLLSYFKNEPDCNAVLHDYIGLKFRIKKEFHNAIMWQEKALELTTNEKIIAMVHYHLSGSYMGCRKLLQSAASLEQAKNLFANNAAYCRVNYCLNEIALLLKSTGQYNLAIEVFKRKLRGNEQLGFNDNVMARDYRNMCWIMILGKKYEEALDYLAVALMKEPKHPLSILYNIWCLYKLNAYDKAELVINDNLQLNEDHEYSANFKLFTSLVKCESKKPSSTCLNLAINIVNSLYNSEEYELCIFYIDIVLEILMRRDEIIETIKFLNMKINLLENA